MGLLGNIAGTVAGPALGPVGGPLVSAVGSLLGGILDKDSKDDANKRAWKRQLIAWGHEDEVRSDERRYAAGQTANNRKYEAARLREQRAYERNLVQSDRIYERNRLAEDRAYAVADREGMQRASDLRAEKGAATRGVDLKKLRDEALAAGFNPLGMLGNAGLYSTEVNYQTIGAPYSSGGGNAVMSSTSPGGSVQAGGSGSGYSASVPAVLASGSFLGEAIERAADTFYSTPARVDPEAAVVKAEKAKETAVQAVAESRIPRSQGFALTDVQPYSPAAQYGAPALAEESPPDPYGEEAAWRSMGGMDGPIAPLAKRAIPVYGLDGQPTYINASTAQRLDIQPHAQLSIEDVESALGDVASEVLGSGTLLNATKTQFPGTDLKESAKSRIEQGARDYFGAFGVGKGPRRTDSQEKARAESVVRAVKDHVPQSTWSGTEEFYPELADPAYDWMNVGRIRDNF